MNKDKYSKEMVCLMWSGRSARSFGGKYRQVQQGNLFFSCEVEDLLDLLEVNIDKYSKEMVCLMWSGGFARFFDGKYRQVQQGNGLSFDFLLTVIPLNSNNIDKSKLKTFMNENSVKQVRILMFQRIMYEILNICGISIEYLLYYIYNTVLTENTAGYYLGTYHKVERKMFLSRYWIPILSPWMELIKWRSEND